MTKREKLSNFILENFSLLEYDSGSGKSLKFPEFQLHALDYLKFAEEEMENRTTRSLINCISHLKHATDCQMDTFLHVLNLYKVFDKKNLKFDVKLKFLKDIGLFSSKSLSRLNVFRNRMEHYYEVPKINDIEVYYDLITAFVGVLQGALSILANYGSGVGMYIDETENNSFTRFSIEYHYDEQQITANWDTKELEEELIVKVNEQDDFTYFLKVLFLIHHRESYASDSYIINQLAIVI
ncbi:hypothetical protein [Cohnella silvisoli]|uniref:Uncharacterized protein n=1 Tax=Cohnella silvisoli TaxID=2873699 RepID=A0ABV1L0N4_9BACL|nr:hypothetical protein [Cohnella silvisoli]MCD9024708.1 hypothetical protein [Cohnella silvisoli]